MRLNLNLSRQPFTNRRIFWTGIAILFLASFWLWLSIIADKSFVSARTDELERRVKEQEAQVAILRVEQENKQKVVPPVILTEQDQIQLVSARQIVSRKAFSWNRLIANIESYVPDDARVVSIAVSEVVAADDAVYAAVQIKALGQSPAHMTEMMAKLEKSEGLFSIRQSSQDATDDGGLIPFTLDLTYRASRGGL